MDELLEWREVELIELFLQKILDRLDIVVGRFFDIFNPPRIR